MTDPRTWIGADVAGGQAELLGQVGAVYFDNTTGRPAWVAVRDRHATALVPLELSRFDGRILHLPFGVEQLRTAPHHDPAAQLSYQDGADLYRHYGIPAQRAGCPETALIDAAVSGSGDHGAMVRAEERLMVGAETVITGRVRLRKYLVTEDQTFVVPVTREEIDIAYDEVPPAQRVRDAGGVLSEQTVDVIRYEERVVITKTLVPVERVRLVKHVVATDQIVTGQVHAEHIDVDVTHHPDAPHPST